MKALIKAYYKHIFISIALVSLLSLATAACSPNGDSAASATPTAAHPAASGSATPTTPPGVKLGPQPCPTAVQNPSYWNAFVHKPPESTITRVQCANLMGNASLQALVNVTYQGTGQVLDVHVFDNITNPNPTQIFQLLGLYKGDAKISGYNTLLTAEVNQNSALNRGRNDATYQRDLFREFKWSDGAGTLVPVAFPGIFPDLTRYQAEGDQAQVNQGRQPWKLNAVQVAQALTAGPLFNWGSGAPATLVSGGGSHDVDAIVDVKSRHPGGGSIHVSLSRLYGNSSGGIWEVVAVEAPGLSISAPTAGQRLASPVQVQGKGSAFEGVVGTLRILDRLGNDIGHASAKGTPGNGPATFTTNVTYNSDYHAGTQEGLLILDAYSQADGSINGAVIMKVLLG